MVAPLGGFEEERKTFGEKVRGKNERSLINRVSSSSGAF